MKNKISNIVLLGFAMLLIVACKNPKIGCETFTITDERIDAGVNSAKFTGSFSFSGTMHEMKVIVDTNELMANTVEYSIVLNNDTFSVEIDGLSPNTTYYYRYCIDFGWKEDYLTDIKSFSTQQRTPTVKALEAIAIDTASFQIKCEVVSDGGSPITERGVCWNTHGNPSINDNIVKHSENGVGEYACQMNNLVPNTTYFVRAYAKNSSGLGLGEEVLQFDIQTTCDSLIVMIYCNPTSGGTATGGGVFAYGEICSIHAEAAEYYTFVSWTENGVFVSAETDYSFAVTSSHTLVANFTAKNYVILAEANPEEGGTVTGMGGFDSGEVCTLTATASPNYEFVKWTKGDMFISSDASFSFTVTESATYIAHFQAKTYTVSVLADPTNGGLVSGDGSYSHGQNCTLTAIANEGFDFVKWTREDEFVSSNASYTFPVTNSAIYTAHFQATSYTISISVHPSDGGSVLGSGSYTYGQSCTLQAIANTGYIFNNWTEEGSQWSTTESSFTFIVTGNRTLVANFIEQAPVGAIDGLFTINSNEDHVYFSKGNLLYIGSAGFPYWKFADQQWYHLGNNGQGSTSQNVDRDLFGWGTSGMYHGAICYQPWSTSNTNSDYQAYGEPNLNLYDRSGEADWGYNAISNGGNQTQRWRTLNREEWKYVINQRNASTVNGTANARYVKATVNNVAGVILFPDIYTHPNSIIAPNSINVPDASFASNNYSGNSWILMETNGCVFLPVNGSRYGISVNDPEAKGYYWSSSYSNDNNSYGVNFSNSNMNAEFSSSRSTGQCVRLVYPIR